MGSRLTTVDVRDMVCAQALAHADRAIRQVTAGEALEILCNADDVQDDLLAWARQRGHVLMRMHQLEDGQALLIRAGTSRPPVS